MEKDADFIEKSDSATVGGASRYTRCEAVQRQLEMAVRARLQHNDLVSALTLAGAAERVLSDLQPKDATVSDGYHSIRAFVNEYIEAKHRQTVASDIRKAYDQLRHSDAQPNFIHELEPRWVDAFLAMTTHAFASKNLTKTDFVEWFYDLPPVLAVHHLWCFLTDPRVRTETQSHEHCDPNVLARFDQLPSADVFEALLSLVESKSLIPNTQSLPLKSLIPNPKSLANPSPEQ